MPADIRRRLPGCPITCAPCTNLNRYLGATGKTWDFPNAAGKKACEKVRSKGHGQAKVRKGGRVRIGGSK